MCPYGTPGILGRFEAILASLAFVMSGDASNAFPAVLDITRFRFMFKLKQGEETTSFLNTPYIIMSLFRPPCLVSVASNSLHKKKKSCRQKNVDSI